MTILAALRTQGRRLRIPVTAMAGGLAFASLCVSPLWIHIVTDPFQEASPTQYEDLALVAAACPPLARDAANAVSDDMLDRAEAGSLAKRIRTMSSAYYDARELNEARATMHLSPHPLPAACDAYPEGHHGLRGLLGSI